MRTAVFDFVLPEHLIALAPAEPRDTARMLRIDASKPGPPIDSTVGALVELLTPQDVLVLNNTRVIAAALEGIRSRDQNRIPHSAPDRARVSFNLVKRLDDSRWQAFARPAKRLAEGDTIRFGGRGRVCLAGELDARVVEMAELATALHTRVLAEGRAAKRALVDDRAATAAAQVERG